MTTPPQTVGATRSLQTLGDARFLAALAVLLVNDLYLKTTHSGFVSGKLSDVAGFVVFPVLIAAVASVVAGGLAGASGLSRPNLPWRGDVLIVAFVVVWFVGLQASPMIDGLHETFVGWLLPWSPANTPDLTDLVTIPAAFVGWQVLADARRSNSWTVELGSKGRAAVLSVGVLACVADQPPPQPEFGPVVEDPDGTLEVRLSDEGWDFARLESTDRGETWTRSDRGQSADVSSDSSGDPTSGSVSPQGCLNDEPDRCFTVEFGEGTDVRIVEVFDGETTEVWRHIDERYARETWGSPFGPGNVNVLSDDTVIVTTRGGPIVRRDSSGTWSPDPLSLRRGEALAYVVLIGAVIVATLGALMLRGHRLLKTMLVVSAGALTFFLPAPQHVDLGLVGFVWIFGVFGSGAVWIVLMAVTIIRGLQAERRSQREGAGGPTPVTRLLLGLIPLLIVGPAIPWLLDVDVRLSAVWYGNWMLLIIGGIAIIALSPTESKLRNAGS